MTIAPATDAAPEDAAKAPAKEGFEREAVDGTAGVDRLFDTLATADRGGDSSSSSSIYLHQDHSRNFYHSNRQIKITLIIKINLVLFISISTSNA